MPESFDRRLVSVVILLVNQFHLGVIHLIFVVGQFVAAAQYMKDLLQRLPLELQRLLLLLLQLPAEVELELKEKLPALLILQS